MTGSPSALFEEDRFVVRLHQRVLTEGRIVACWLGGSITRLPDDPYADFYACLVYADEAAREAAWAERRAFCRSILSYVPACSVDHAEPYRHSALYANGAQVDFRFLALSAAQPHPADAEIKILKDTADQWAARFQTLCRQTPAWVQPPDSAGLRALDEAFWVGLWKIYRQLRRGDSDAPFAHYLDLLARALPPLLDQLPADDPARRALIDVAYGRDAAANLRQLRRLGRAYRDARDAVVRRARLAYSPDDAFERQLQRALDK